MNEVTKIVIAVDTQSGAKGGWAYWVYTNDGFDSSGPLGGKYYRERSLISLKRELRRERPKLKSFVLCSVASELQGVKGYNLT